MAHHMVATRECWGPSRTTPGREMVDRGVDGDVPRPQPGPVSCRSPLKPVGHDGYEDLVDFYTNTAL